MCNGAKDEVNSNKPFIKCYSTNLVFNFQRVMKPRVNYSVYIEGLD